jgi:hypothetical protein
MLDVRDLLFRMSARDDRRVVLMARAFATICPPLKASGIATSNPRALPTLAAVGARDATLLLGFMRGASPQRANPI